MFTPTNGFAIALTSFRGLGLQSSDAQRCRKSVETNTKIAFQNVGPYICGLNSAKLSEQSSVPRWHQPLFVYRWLYRQCLSKSSSVDQRSTAHNHSASLRQYHRSPKMRVSWQLIIFLLSEYNPTVPSPLLPFPVTWLICHDFNPNSLAYVRHISVGPANYVMKFHTYMSGRRCHWIFIRLEARLRPKIGFTLRSNLAVFTRSAISPPKVNWFGWNLEHSECIDGGWPGGFWAWSAQ